LGLKDFKLTPAMLPELIRLLKELLTSGKAYRVNVKEWKPNASLSAKAQVQVWFQQISEETGENKKDIEARCKRDFGLPILWSRGFEDDVAAITDYTLQKLGVLSWCEEDQLKFISVMAVTRHFKTSEHNRYRDSVQQYYNQHGFNLQYLDKQEA
jgi:hypothetical protein